MKRIIIVGVTLFCSIFQVKAQQYATKIDSLINKAVSLKRFNGTVLVSKSGKIVFEKAYGYQDIQNKIENTPNTIFQVGSMTKQFTAAVVLKLAEQQKLSLDDKISKYFPTLKRCDEIILKIYSRILPAFRRYSGPLYL
ncbi:MAG: serine hydrolase domain-containing protein [Ginsengibacter sp.]